MISITRNDGLKCDIDLAGNGNILGCIMPGPTTRAAIASAAATTATKLIPSPLSLARPSPLGTAWRMLLATAWGDSSFNRRGFKVSALDDRGSLVDIAGERQKALLNSRDVGSKCVGYCSSRKVKFNASDEGCKLR